MDRVICTPRCVLRAVAADAAAHHHAGLIGGRQARRRRAALRAVAAGLGEDLDRPITRDEMWALHERASALTRDRRTAESLRGVLGRHLIAAATAERRRPATPGQRRRHAAPELHATRARGVSDQGAVASV